MATTGTVPATMKALVKTKEAVSFDLQQVPVPEPAGDEVLIKVDAVSVCGSDINMYTWNDVAKVIATIPFTPGHECAGTVVKCGPDANIPVGSKVGVENHYFCGTCYQCTHDTREICLNMGQFGHGKQTPYGGCSEYTIVPAKFLYVLTRPLTPDQIAMLEPLGVAHNAVERLDCKGEDVLVIGCGAVGILVQKVAMSLGAKRYIDDALSLNNKKCIDNVDRIYPPELEIKDTTDSSTSAANLYIYLQYDQQGQLTTMLYDKRNDFDFPVANFPFLDSSIPAPHTIRIIAADIDDAKLKFAKDMGADVTVNTKENDIKEFIKSFTEGVGMGRICECSGAAVMVNATFPMLRKGGQLVLVGLPKQPLHVENVLQDVVFKAMTLKTVHGRRIYHTWRETEALVAEGKVNVDQVITHRYPMTQFEDAFKVLMAGQACKIVLYPSQ